MAITIARANAHIAQWERAISGAKSAWPKFVYHTAHVTVIPEILRSGMLIPRARQIGMVYDVAKQEALWRNPDAHQYSRFYFRPKTLFHVMKEGIRCLRDNRRPQTQMSVPIILAFNAEKLLSLNGINYTRQKFANRGEDIGSDQTFFDSINFAAVYHDGPTQLREVRHGRMAEVLYLGSLPLQNNLEYIFCRTVYDRITLLSMLTPVQRAFYRDKIKVEKISGSFFVHEFSMYIRDLKVFDNSVFMTLKHPSSIGAGTYKCTVRQIISENQTIAFSYVIPFVVGAVQLRGFVSDPNCTWEIELEDLLAFRGKIPSENSALV